MANKLFNQLVEELIGIKDKKLMRNFLEGLFTPQELEEIPMRVQIVKLLKKGMPQHEIAEKLGVGVATVTRGSKEIAKGHFKTI